MRQQGVEARNAVVDEKLALLGLELADLQRAQVSFAQTATVESVEKWVESLDKRMSQLLLDFDQDRRSKKAAHDSSQNNIEAVENKLISKIQDCLYGPMGAVSTVVE